MTGFTDYADLGFFPLQDHAHGDDGTPVSARQMLAAGRISELKPLDEVSTADEAVLRYGRAYDLGTLGDVHPWLFWQTRERAARGMGSWAQVFGALAVDADAYYGSIGAQPLRDLRFVNDSRYRELDPAWPAGLSRVPRGAILTILPGTDEASQNELAVWTDPRLVAPNVSGPGECGTLVVDMQPTHELCMDAENEAPGIAGRAARLQSLVRVISVQPNSTFGDALGGGPGNTLALNFGLSGVDRIPNFGAFFGYADTRGGGGGGPITGGPSSSTPTSPTGPITGPRTGPRAGGRGSVQAPPSSPAELRDAGRATRGTSNVGRGSFGGDAEAASTEDEFEPKGFGKWSRNFVADHAIGLMAQIGAYGPLTPGATDDKHRHGRDRDGHPINAAHISTRAFFFDDATRDAPIEFGGGYPGPRPLPIPAPAHLSYDVFSSHQFGPQQKSGLWRFWCETPDVQPTVPPSSPPGTPSSPPSSPPSTPTTPTTPPTTPPTTTPPTGRNPRGPGDTVPPPPTITRPVTPNQPGGPGGKRFPGYPTTPQPPNGPLTGGTPGPANPGGAGGNPSTPCKLPAITGTPPGIAGPQTGGPARPAPPTGPTRTGNRPASLTPVWPAGGRGGGGGGGTLDPAAALSSASSSAPPLDRRFFNSGGGELLPLSAGVSGRGYGGAPSKDPRLDLDRRIDGRPVPTAGDGDTQPGVADEIGTTEGRVGLYALFRPMAQGFAAVQFRPQMTVAGYPNFEHNPSMPAERYYQDERARPQTVVMRAWGAQRNGEGDWAYVETPDDARARGGTGDGGVLFHPPRFELEDYYGIGNAGLDVTDTTSAQATTSYVLVAPGVKHAYGLPNPDGTVQPGGSSTTYGGPTKPQVTSVHTSAGTLTALEVNYDSAGAEVVVGFGQNQAVQIPAGTTAQRPSGVAPAAGMFRYNTSNSEAEIYNGSAWEAVGSASGDITTSDLTMSTQRLLGNAEAAGSTGSVQQLVLDSDDFTLTNVDPPTLSIASISTAQLANSAVTGEKLASGGQYHGTYDTTASTQRAAGDVTPITCEVYYTARPDGDGYAESEETATPPAGARIVRRLYYSDKFNANPTTSADWTAYTTQPADGTSFATAKASLLAGLDETDATANTRGTLPVSLKMEYEAVVDRLLDDYPGAEAAYSVRLIDKDYSGSCMRVRNVSTNDTADIGFDANGDLDEGAIETLCGSANGAVEIWYDQSGGGHHQVQETTTLQPFIYLGSAGAVLKENGKPVIVFTDGGQLQNVSHSTVTVNLMATFGSASPTPGTTFAVVGPGGDYSTYSNFIIGTTSGGGAYYGFCTSSGTGILNSNFTCTFHVNQSEQISPTRTSLYSTIDPQAVVTAYWTAGVAGPLRWYINYNFAFSGSLQVQEYVIYYSDKSSDQAAIEDAINDYYGAYT